MGVNHKIALMFLDDSIKWCNVETRNLKERCVLFYVEAK